MSTVIILACVARLFWVVFRRQIPFCLNWCWSWTHPSFDRQNLLVVELYSNFFFSFYSDLFFSSMEIRKLFQFVFYFFFFGDGWESVESRFRTIFIVLYINCYSFKLWVVLNFLPNKFSKSFQWFWIPTLLLWNHKLVL